MAEAVLPEKIIEVLPATNAQTAVPQRVTTIPSQTLSDSEQEYTQTGEQNESLQQGDNSAGIWQLLAITEGIALAVVLVLLFRRRNTDEQLANKCTDDTPAAAKKLIRMIKLACDKNDASLCRQALLDWAKVNFPDESVIGLSDVNRLLNSQLSAEFREMTASQYKYRTANLAGRHVLESI